MSTTRYTRQLAAILHADVVSYSKLTGDDEDGTYSRLNEYMNIITDKVKSWQAPRLGMRY
jgi:class 3 adenylate cyclase